MSLKHGLLGLLNYGPHTGYDLGKLFENSLAHFWKAQTSQVYRELNALENKRLLESELVICTGGPNRKLYKLTPQGKAELDAWLANDSDLHGMAVRSLFLLKLFFAGDHEDESGKSACLRLLRTFYENNLEALNSLNALGEVPQGKNQAGTDFSNLAWNLVADYGRQILAMNVQWAEQQIQKVEAL